MKIMGTLFGVFLVAASSPLAHAAVQISFSFTNPAAAVLASSVGGCTTSGTGPTAPGETELCYTGGQNIGSGVTVLDLSTTGQQNVSNSEQLGSSLEIETGSTAVTLTIWLAASGFTEPTAPPDIDYSSKLSITSNTGVGTVSLESCVDTSNGLAPPTNTFCASPAATLTTSAGSETYSGSASNSQTDLGVITSLLTTPYSLSQKITLTLGANSDLNVITSQILTPVPEPMSIALLGGVLILVSRAMRRKRNQENSSV